MKGSSVALPGLPGLEFVSSTGGTTMRLYLINPRNPLVSMTRIRESHWNRYRVWKPLGLATVAALTPPDWDTNIFDENIVVPDHSALPRPDLVGITAFTSQAPRAYEIAAEYRRHGVPVVMGGIHATMCSEEAMAHVDAVVTGEAERMWTQVLADVQHGALQLRYDGVHADMAEIPPARHDLLTGDYAFASIQTTRGCPLNCSFCSVTAFNGYRYRLRPVAHVVQEFKTIPEKLVLVVDDNLIGTGHGHVTRAKDLFRAMIRARLRKRWIAQVTINFADDDELLMLAAKAGCVGVFIGFESPTAEGLMEVGKKFNMLNGRDFPASVRRIQQHKILVAGSFIMGLDTDEPGIGRRIAEAGTRYGIDVLNTLFLTPLPGTQLWTEMKSQHRLVADSFPEDWQYYTLTFPVAQYQHLSCHDILSEMEACETAFFSLSSISRRVWRTVRHWRRPFVALVANLSYRSNIRLGHADCRTFMLSRGLPHDEPPENKAEGASRSARCRDDGRNRTEATPRGCSQLMSVASHDNKRRSCDCLTE